MSSDSPSCGGPKLGCAQLSSRPLQFLNDLNYTFPDDSIRRRNGNSHEDEGRNYMPIDKGQRKRWSENPQGEMDDRKQARW